MKMREGRRLESNESVFGEDWFLVMYGYANPNRSGRAGHRNRDLAKTAAPARYGKILQVPSNRTSTYHTIPYSDSHRKKTKKIPDHDVAA